MITSTVIRPPLQHGPDPKPMVVPGRSLGDQVLVKIFVLIWILEKLGWITDVRWTNPERLARITTRT